MYQCSPAIWNSTFWSQQEWLQNRVQQIPPALCHLRTVWAQEHLQCQGFESCCGMGRFQLFTRTTYFRRALCSNQSSLEWGMWAADGITLKMLIFYYTDYVFIRVLAEDSEWSVFFWSVWWFQLSLEKVQKNLHNQKHGINWTSWHMAHAEQI